MNHENDTHIGDISGSLHLERSFVKFNRHGCWKAIHKAMPWVICTGKKKLFPFLYLWVPHLLRTIVPCVCIMISCVYHNKGQFLMGNLSRMASKGTRHFLWSGCQSPVWPHMPVVQINITDNFPSLLWRLQPELFFERCNCHNTRYLPELTSVRKQDKILEHPSSIFVSKQFFGCSEQQ